ncbi:MAG: hypothetical protein CMN76_18400 [Spirochaetaceae bacterium]|nr:hypothetical protein [Spirochaetaceae bacterium]|tara:strand:+ start:262160 stop:262435 length:276 start_codon:yes stop_codon:yes gene_type:complete
MKTAKKRAKKTSRKSTGKSRTGGAKKSAIQNKATSATKEAEINPQQRMFASRPTGFTLWLRKSLVWQFIRFVVINIRMLFMIGKAQPRKIG